MGDIFKAIADPTRRQIIGLVMTRELTLNEVASRFSISRPAISRHIKILTASGLITVRNEGRERYCRAHPAKLQEVTDWIEQYRQFWTAKLDSLGEFLKAPDQSSNQ